VWETYAPGLFPYTAKFLTDGKSLSVYASNPSTSSFNFGAYAPSLFPYASGCWDMVRSGGIYCGIKGIRPEFVSICPEFPDRWKNPIGLCSGVLCICRQIFGICPEIK